MRHINDRHPRTLANDVPVTTFFTAGPVSTTVEHRPLIKGCEDTAFIVASSFVDAMLVKMRGHTMSRENAKLIARMVELHLAGDIHEFEAVTE